MPAGVFSIAVRSRFTFSGQAETPAAVVDGAAEPGNVADLAEGGACFKNAESALASK